MTNENDLIRRGEAVLEVQALIGSTSDKPYCDAIDAINTIPAVSGEPVGMKMEADFYHSVGYDKRGGKFLWWGEIPFGAKLYTTPQDQSARIDELEAHPMQRRVRQ